MNAPAQLTPVAISPVEEIVAEMKAGRIVILVDEEDRENEGDLVLASDHVTPEAINFMARLTGLHLGHDLFDGRNRHGGQLCGRVHAVSFWTRPALSMRST